jgi:hypothetical protein
MIIWIAMVKIFYFNTAIAFSAEVSGFFSAIPVSMRIPLVFRTSISRNIPVVIRNAQISTFDGNATGLSNLPQYLLLVERTLLVDDR